MFCHFVLWYILQFEKFCIARNILIVRLDLIVLNFTDN